MHQACNASRKDVKKLHSAGAGDIPGWLYHVNKAARIPFRHDAPYLSRATARRPEPESSSLLVRRSYGKRNSVAVRSHNSRPTSVHLCGTEGRVEIRIPVNPGARRADPVQGRWLIAGAARCARRDQSALRRGNRDPWHAHDRCAVRLGGKPKTLRCKPSIRCECREGLRSSRIEPVAKHRKVGISLSIWRRSALRHVFATSTIFTPFATR